MTRLLLAELRSDWRTWAGAAIVALAAAVIVNVSMSYFWSIAMPVNPAVFDAANSPDREQLMAGALVLLLAAAIPSIIVLAVVLGIVNSQQVVRHGLWRLAGAIPREMASVFLAQALLVSVAGGAIGVLCSLPLVEPTARFMLRFGGAPDFDLPAMSGASSVASTFVIVVALTVISSALPTMKASRTSAVVLIRNDDSVRRIGVLRLITAGGATMVFLLQLPVIAFAALSSGNEAAVVGVTLNLGQILVVAVALWAPLLAPVILRLWTAIVPKSTSVTWFLARHSTRARLGVSTATVTPLMVGLALYGLFFGVVATWQRALESAGSESSLNVLDGFVLFTPGALVAAIGSIVAVFMVSRTRNREMALLRTAGATSSDVTRMLTFEALIYSLTSAILAILIVLPIVVLAGVALALMGYPLAIGIDIVVPLLLLGLGFIGMLAVILMTGRSALARPAREILMTG